MSGHIEQQNETMKTLIWDFDGTMADSFPFVGPYLARKAGQEMGPEEVRQLVGRVSMRDMAHALEIPKRRFVHLFVEGRKVMGEQIRNGKIHPFEGIPEVLHELYEADAEHKKFFALTSNSKKNVWAFLEKHHLAQYFEDVKGNASVLGKAHALRVLLRRNGLDAADCICIGDEEGDIKAARKVGARVVATTWGYNSKEILEHQHPWAVADEPEDLPKILLG